MWIYIIPSLIIGIIIGWFFSYDIDNIIGKIRHKDIKTNDAVLDSRKSQIKAAEKAQKEQAEELRKLFAASRKDIKRHLINGRSV